jgi:hypothetical protein
VSKRKAPESPRNPARLATILSVIAIVLSTASFLLNYLSSLPTIQAKIELVEPLAPSQDIHTRVLLQNTGKTTAKHLQPNVAFKFQRADIPFEATYEAKAPLDFTPVTSDLVPGGHSTLVSTNRKSLTHDHDVAAVLSGQWKLYLYGKIPYQDILHFSHEVHFCGFYQQVPGMEPLKFSYCSSYNETE